VSVRIFRWRAIGPLFVFTLLGGVLWVLFADHIARRAAEAIGTSDRRREGRSRPPPH